VWTIVTILGIFAAVVIAMMIARSRRPRPTDPHRQPPVESAAHGDLPEPGSDESARRPDGSPMPGSKEDRHRHGKP